MKSNLISVNHPYAATSDILILFAALFIQIVALQTVPVRWPKACHNQRGAAFLPTK